MWSPAIFALFLSWLIFRSVPMQCFAADLGQNNPTRNRISCIISGYTSQCIPDACHLAGGRCVPNEKETKCIPKLQTNLGLRVLSWTRHSETAQACQDCTCVQQSLGATFKSGRKKVEKRDENSTETEEAALTLVNVLAAGGQLPVMDCEMWAREGEFCNEAECQKEGGRCLPLDNRKGGGYTCFTHMLEKNGKFSAVRFDKSFRELPSCTRCRCKQKKYARTPRKKQPTKMLYDSDCHMVDKPRQLCKEADCKREGGLCSPKQTRGRTMCVGHIWKEGQIFSILNLAKSPSLPSCSGCRCASKGSLPKYMAAKLAGKRKPSEEQQSSPSKEQQSSPSIEDTQSLSSAELSQSSLDSV